MFNCPGLSFKPCFHGFWPLVDGISHWKINVPIDDEFVMIGWILMLMHGLVMIGDELVPFDHPCRMLTSHTAEILDRRPACQVFVLLIHVYTVDHGAHNVDWIHWTWDKPGRQIPCLLQCDHPLEDVDRTHCRQWNPRFCSLLVWWFVRPIDLPCGLPVMSQAWVKG